MTHHSFDPHVKMLSEYTRISEDDLVDDENPIEVSAEEALDAMWEYGRDQVKENNRSVDAEVNTRVNELLQNIQRELESCRSIDEGDVDECMAVIKRVRHEYDLSVAVVNKLKAAEPMLYEKMQP